MLIDYRQCCPVAEFNALADMLWLNLNSADCKLLCKSAVLASSGATWSTGSVYNIFISLRGSCNICAAPCP